MKQFRMLIALPFVLGWLVCAAAAFLIAPEFSQSVWRDVYFKVMK